MSKYIIRNCNVIYFNLDKTAICNDLNLECPCYCKERTDCLLKQIVKLCKGVENIENVETLYDAKKSGMFLQANRILKLLDIQECE